MRSPSPAILPWLALLACGDDSSSRRPVAPERDAEVVPGAASSFDASAGHASTFDATSAAVTDAGGDAAGSLDGATRTSSTDDGGSASDGATDVDAGAADGRALDAQNSRDAALTPEGRACPFENVCRAAAYPCVGSDDGQGFQCRGQFAAWPMPDRRPGAKFPPNYTVFADRGTVLDEVTGLLWQRGQPESYAGCTGNHLGTVGDTCTFTEAEAYCAQLELDGKRWRLPSKIELESLLDYDHHALGTYIDTTTFPDTAALRAWSSSKVLGTADASYGVDFNVGLPFTGPTSTGRHKVRCVRSERIVHAPPSERYDLQSATSTLRDLYTQLEWQVPTEGNPLPSFATRDQAAAHCSSAGSGFRLPTIKELLTLMDITRTPYAVDVLLVQSGVPGRHRADQLHWSDTPNKIVPGSTLVYSTSLGMLVDDRLAKEEGVPILARCVR